MAHYFDTSIYISLDTVFVLVRKAATGILSGYKSIFLTRGVWLSSYIHIDHIRMYIIGQSRAYSTLDEIIKYDNILLYRPAGSHCLTDWKILCLKYHQGLQCICLKEVNCTDVSRQKLQITIHVYIIYNWLMSCACLSTILSVKLMRKMEELCCNQL